VTTLKEGVANSNLEVLTAQKSVLAVKLDAIDNRQQQFNAAIDLYRALGGGW
jgi:multidrug efflux system outer membrane protein